MSNKTYPIGCFTYSELSKEEQEEIRNDDANCIKIGNRLYSDAMEPEDATFSRDLSWICDEIERAYKQGFIDGEAHKLNSKMYNGYVIVTNSDLTDGRGRDLNVGWTLNRFTANRVALGKGVQGSTADVFHTIIYKIGHQLFGPISLVEPSASDVAKEKSVHACIALQEKYGISDVDLEILKSS